MLRQITAELADSCKGLLMKLRRGDKTVTSDGPGGCLGGNEGAANPERSPLVITGCGRSLLEMEKMRGIGPTLLPDEEGASLSISELIHCLCLLRGCISTLILRAQLQLGRRGGDASHRPPNNAIILSFSPSFSRPPFGTRGH